jgi:hypothetical protein
MEYVGGAAPWHDSAQQVVSEAWVVWTEDAREANLTKHINAFNRVVSDLARIEVKVKNEDKGFAHA